MKPEKIQFETLQVHFRVSVGIEHIDDIIYDFESV